MEISEIINHYGEERNNYYKAVSPPIFQNSIFCFNTIDELREGLKDELNTPFYTRGLNPTVLSLRKKLAALEKTDDALVFASGCAAISAAVISSVKQNDHVICVENPYSWTNVLLTNLLKKFGVSTTFVDGKDIQNFKAAIQDNTTLIYLESPNSITFELQDLSAVAELAKENNITTICDNSYSTPLNQNPISLGIDIVVHSASKYLGGHSDIVAGVLCSSKERVRKIFESELMTLGGILSPNDAWLMMRGIRTLELRVNKATENGFKVLDYLENHPLVEKVLHPFSQNNPQLELAKKQMKPCGGLFSVYIKADNIEEIDRFINYLQKFIIACSWGGYESLVFPMAALSSSENYANGDKPWNLVRFYTGLEDADELINDIDNAFKNMKH